MLRKCDFTHPSVDHYEMYIINIKVSDKRSYNETKTREIHLRTFQVCLCVKMQMQFMCNVSQLRRLQSSSWYLV